MVTAALSPSRTHEEVIVIDPIPMTHDTFLEGYDKEAGRRGEWADGQAISFLRTSVRHNEVVVFLVRQTGSFLDSMPLGRVFVQEVELRTRATSHREPDVGVVLNQNAHRIEEMRIRGAGGIVVEVVSPDSVTRDRQIKLAEYAAAGVTEYWMIDPRHSQERIDLLVLGADREHLPVEPDDHGGLASTDLPGVWLETSWLTEPEFPHAGRLGTRMAGAAGSD